MIEPQRQDQEFGKGTASAFAEAVPCELTPDDLHQLLDFFELLARWDDILTGEPDNA